MKIHGGTTDWHCSWILLQKIDLNVIVVKLTFTYIYFYLSTCVYMTDIPVYWYYTRLLSSVHFWFTGLLLMYTSVLQGDKYTWLWFYNMSESRTAPVTAIRMDNPVSLRNTVLRALPEPFGFWVTPAVSTCILLSGITGQWQQNICTATFCTTAFRDNFPGFACWGDLILS